MSKIIITKEQIEALRPYLSNIDELVNGELNDLEEAIKDEIMDALDEEWADTKDSIILQRLFDEIFYQND
ncbi:MAG: hypothetical protein PUK83_05705 [Clostridia bacterium]|nr:hypothetical protein [Clostridia bacterium]MDY5264010.1 hypothetical protein [Eubacteriales bacterium]